LSQTNDKDLQNIYVEKTSEYKNDEMRTVAKGYYALLKDEDTRRQAVANSFTGESGDVQLKIQARQLEKAPTDSIVQEAHTEALGQGHIEQDAQQGFAKNIRLASNNLDEQNKEKVQKRLIDANINGCAPENQAAIYEDIVSNTDLVSVQEYAASNIYKLDESVRDWAEEFTKSLDIESVTNAIQTEPPVIEEQKTTVDNSYNNYENNETISIAEVNAVNNTIQEIKNTLIEESTGEIKLDLNKQEDRDKLVEFFEQHPIEMAKYIERAPLKNKEAMLVTLCKASKSAAVAFVKQNPSLGLIILSSSQIELGIQHDVAKAMLQKADKGSDIWRAASDFLGKFYKGETTLPEAQKNSIAFKA